MKPWVCENGEGTMLKLTMTGLWKRIPPITETLAFKVFKTLPKLSQLVQNALKSVSKSQNQKNPEETEENGIENEAQESLNIPKSRRTN